VSQWKRQLLENASELFGRGKKNKDKEAGEAKEAAGVAQKKSQLL
jgi:hypothetical protein